MKEARSVLSQVLKSFGLEQRVRGFQAGESWAGIVGPALAGRTTVVDFKDGRLTVEVTAPAAMAELKLRTGEFLKAFAEKHGEGLIREIRFVPGTR